MGKGDGTGMKINVVGRRVEVTDDLKAWFEKKLAKFDKFFRDDAVASIKLRHERGKDILELTITSGGTIFRSEQEDSTFLNAFDRAMEAIERQIRKNKTRLEKRLREGAFVPDAATTVEPVEEEGEFKIRVKEFPIKPMSPEEAILQMNLLDHAFYLFINAETGEPNVVYKRKDNNYGLIVPSDKE